MRLMKYTKEFFQKKGRVGGLSSSEAKVRASKENGKKGGRPPKIESLNGRR